MWWGSSEICVADKEGVELSTEEIHVLYACGKVEL